ncbi:MAG: penicillin-binding transpeptidase domain-containing protein, partial [Gemmatimonadota bacterium]
RATQARRQPGSVFKPFVYTAAIASDIPPSHVIWDSPITLEVDDTTRWTPSNYTDEFHGEMTLREALQRSINVVAIKLGQTVGTETVAQYARRMGIQTPIPRGPSMAIGSADVVPIQVLEAYTTFANQGVRVTPRAIRRVEDATGRVLWSSEVERERVLDVATAHIVRDMLRSVVDAGTAYGAVRELGAIPDSLPIGGKTGTTNDFTDIWFVGFTPDIVAGAWFGLDDPETIFDRATGGVWAAPAWTDFIRGVYMPDSATVDLLATADSAGTEEASDTSAAAATAAAFEPPAPLIAWPPDTVWSRPPGLIERRIDARSGKLATEWCPIEDVRPELFIPGTEPTEACDQHGPGLVGAPMRDFVPDTAIPDTIPPDSVADDTLGIGAAPAPRPRDTAAGTPPDTTGAAPGSPPDTTGAAARPSHRR